MELVAYSGHGNDRSVVKKTPLNSASRSRIHIVLNLKPYTDFHVVVHFTTHFFPRAQHLLVGQGSLIFSTSRPHSNTAHSVGLLWTSDQPDAETSTWRHTTLTTDTQQCQTHNPSKRETAVPRLRPRGHLDRFPIALQNIIINSIINKHKFKLLCWYLRWLQLYYNFRGVST